MVSNKPFLVADIGGTNARFAMAHLDGQRVSITNAQTFRIEDFLSPCEAALAFLKTVLDKPDHACLAVAGPVSDTVIKLTNCPWIIDQNALQHSLGLKSLLMVNDFEALAYGVTHLQTGDSVRIKSGTANPSAPSLVIGPGTGFGQALIFPTSREVHVLATQGGHIGFAPHTDEQIEVKRYIARDHHRVCVEHVLSGSGLTNIYDALAEIAGEKVDRMQPGDITQAAIDQTDPIAQRTLDLFFAILGDVAGDLVLATGSRGGVFLGGGILPRLNTMLINSEFADVFTQKGAMTPYLDPVPVRLITREGVALLGAGTIMRIRAEHGI